MNLRKKYYVPSPGCTTIGWEGDRHVPGTDVRLADLSASGQAVARQYESEINRLYQKMSALAPDDRPSRWQRLKNWLIIKLGGYTEDGYTEDD